MCIITPNGVCVLKQLTIPINCEVTSDNCCKCKAECTECHITMYQGQSKGSIQQSAINSLLKN